MNVRIRVLFLVCFALVFGTLAEANACGFRWCHWCHHQGRWHSGGSGSGATGNGSADSNAEKLNPNVATGAGPATGTGIDNESASLTNAKLEQLAAEWNGKYAAIQDALVKVPQLRLELDKLRQDLATIQFNMDSRFVAIEEKINALPTKDWMLKHLGTNRGAADPGTNE